LYTTVPAVGAFARLNFIDTVHNQQYEEVAGWFKNWEDVGLIGWVDKNNDGVIQYGAGSPFQGKPVYSESRGTSGERTISNIPTSAANEVYVDRDIMVLANPEIADLPPWVIALVAAGSLAAALSTAAGLLLVISAAISHDLLKKTFARGITERQELLCARLAAASAIVVAGYLGINPPGFVAQVVAFAFGLAAASLFPPIVMGIFSMRMNTIGAVSGMLTGLTLTFCYIVYFKFYSPEMNVPANWWFGISPEGIGAVGALANFIVAWSVALCSAPPPDSVRQLVADIRIPKGAGAAGTH
jgi:cation/acetate symporter